ncbi:N-acyl homoserine lactonase family protein [Roseomonas sp. OT10]|uniref:N-acyl homoserine lactonase family protein n=1 Tax=Roseomonas cutis TaxID=2897332 RepID=UPI001E5DF519|nr:N-acyl homoserine lactonase family protein [Roseomonas sp. OT10]UFN46951.1 N-acyl homoserine lactonase family protein [Roseomonas sp. OT10]
MSWEAYAIRYAEDPLRPGHRSFLDGSGGAEPMPLAYLTFVLRGPEGVVMVDTGADDGVVARLGKRPLANVAAALGALGIDPGEVRTVVQTHLHWDHAGGTALFPNAVFHLQARELAYVNGPAMRHPLLRAGYEPGEIAGMTALLHAGRLTLHDGCWSGPGGIEAFHVGGHTDGLQALAFPTRRGRLCLAGDSAAFRANLERRVPFPSLYSVGDALDAFDRVLEAAGGRAEAVLPGHDPWVMQAHPAAHPGTEGWIVRLD